VSSEGGRADVNGAPRADLIGMTTGVARR
jgi:hypothetical protein